MCFLDNKAYVLMLGVLLLAAVGGADYATGPDYSLSIFYLAPVILAAWFGGMAAGVAISVLAALAWLAAELAGKKYLADPMVLYWNDVMELGFFLTVSLILSALKNALEKEKATARTDHLTGIANRRSFYDLAALEMDISRRYQHPFTVAYLDVDHFKRVNDTLGHAAGDTVLRLVSATIRENVRKADIVARLGGDEFAVLMPETGSEAARTAMAKVTKNLEDAVQSAWPVTFSIGMVTYRTPPASVDDLVKEADKLMYAVKSGGKDMLRHEVVQ